MLSMDSPSIPDSPLKSKEECAQTAEESKFNSLCSTDDDEQHFFENRLAKLCLNHPVSLPNDIISESSSSTSTSAPSQAIPRSIFDYLGTRKTMKKQIRTQPEERVKSIRFQVKGFELVNENDNDEEDGASETCVVYEIEAIEEEKCKRSTFLPIKKSTWQFQSRYSMLREFYKCLKAEMKEKNVELPRFPSRRWLGNTRTSFLQKRQQQLHEFFSEISKDETIMKSKTIADFILESRNAADLEFSL